MSNSTELHRYKRSWASDIWRRLEWLFLGGIGVVALCFIPVVGWVAGLALLGVMLCKVFGPRPLHVEGSCPACTKSLAINPKHDDVFACPTCGSVIRVEPNALTLVPLNHPA